MKWLSNHHHSLQGAKHCYLKPCHVHHPFIQSQYKLGLSLNSANEDLQIILIVHNLGNSPNIGMKLYIFLHLQFSHVEEKCFVKFNPLGPFLMLCSKSFILSEL